MANHYPNHSRLISFSQFENENSLNTSKHFIIQNGISKNDFTSSPFHCMIILVR